MHDINLERVNFVIMGFWYRKVAPSSAMHAVLWLSSVCTKLA